MGNLFSIGEVLIDFIPLQKGKALKDVVAFERVAGGAPANVAATVAKLGGMATLITKIGTDAFGDYLLEQLRCTGINTSLISRTKKANTGLSFVSLREDGERDFSFYRHPSADLLLSRKEIEERWFNKGDILHFGSVDLVESPMKRAHIKAIQSVKARGGIISFDPNVRLSLWDSAKECRNTILDFIPLAHIIKISDEELEFVTGITAEDAAIKSLFVGDVKIIVYTKGSNGAELFLQNKKYTSSGYPVKVEDTTGAGDAFIGGFLYKLLYNDVNQDNLIKVVNKHYKEILSFANASGALTTTRKGALTAIPSKEDIFLLINNQNF